MTLAQFHPRSDLPCMIGSPLISLAFLLSAFSFGCGNERTPTVSMDGSTQPDYSIIPYDFGHPDAAFALPAELLEISGLSAFDSTHLVAVQDEEGIIYFLDRETALITSEGRFSGRGDYEGIEVVDSLIWVLRSDGDLFSVAENGEGEFQATKHETDLHRSCDAEGLAFEASTQRLHIACKENPGRGYEDRRAIYSFELLGRLQSQAPVYLINRQGLDIRGNQFKPSAIAIHPQSGLLYVISSVRKLLVVVDLSQPDTILATRELPESLFPQPEGIAFFQDGTLFISNEGASGPATLLRFDEQTASQ